MSPPKFPNSPDSRQNLSRDSWKSFLPPEQTSLELTPTPRIDKSKFLFVLKIDELTFHFNL